ncbi:MAG: 2Fe-2S iron-sulfur cluster-binding protein, partial [Candidatus Krumholzibacteria bacterium]|nr:2Fe-2S iron-sulfur cluster-binding protein [Candidatus Krumholzibacteria bacterium]
MADKIQMKFNGRDLEVEAGTPLIQLSSKLGEKIPHFCYHPGIGVDGNCRLCLVELTGAPKLVPACTLSASEGMEVTTNSEKVLKARKGVLEFLLINHPLDCPICDKAGECPLQDYTRDYGPAHSRMEDPKNQGVKHKDLGEFIVYDSERCVLCTRCVRFQRDVVGREELLVRHRGDRSRVDLFEDHLLTGSFTGNLADLCPVGALTTRPFRFQARPWEMKKVESHCTACSLHCRAATWWKNDELLRLTPLSDASVNAWWLCDRGRFGSLLEESETRSEMRREGESVPVSASDAFERAKELLLKSGKRSAILAGSRATVEELDAIAKLQRIFRDDLSPFVDLPEERAFLLALEDSDLELKSLSGLDDFDRVVLLGDDPEETHPILSLRLRALPSAILPGGEDLPARLREELSGEDRLLLVLQAPLLRKVLSGKEVLELVAARSGETKVLFLQEGMNQRALALAGGQGTPVMEALDQGELDTLLLFGLDPALDFPEAGDWKDRLARAGNLIV